MNTMTMDGIRYRELLMAGAAMLESQRDVVNNLNVFPVPDGDTGTNMSMTMSSVLSGTHGAIASVADYTAATARDMMRSARGNSGVILSLFFRGMARAFVEKQSITPADLVEAVKQGSKSAAGAVEKPVEGTILTVMRECSVGIENAESLSFEQVFDKLYDNAEVILAKTPEMLPALRRARVVDSGGFGFVRILEGMKNALNGINVATETVNTAPAVNAAADFEAFSTEEITFAFCTECLIDLEGEIPEDELLSLKKKLSTMGDSMVLTADDEIFKLHIHTDEPMTVLGMVFGLGTLRHSKIENMKLQHTGLVTSSEGAQQEAEPREVKKYGIFAVSPGDGFTDLFKELGADGIIAGGQSMNPSAEDILEAIQKCPCENAIILPNNGNIIMAAKQAGELSEGTNVIVIPTKTLPQGVSALFAFNESRTPEENVEEMQDAVSMVTTLSFTRAVRDAEVDGQHVRARQFLGLKEGKVKAADDALERVVATMLRHLDACDIVTIYYGKEVKENVAEQMQELVCEVLGEDVEISLVYGGQPLYPFIISAE